MSLHRPIQHRLHSLLIALALLSLPWAFSDNFQVRLDDIHVDGYTLTVLDDIHEGGSGLIILFVEVDDKPAPGDTSVSVLLRPLGKESFDLARAEYRGPAFYLERQRAMYIALPILFVQSDSYQMRIFLSGIAGQTEFTIEFSTLPTAQE